MRRVFYRDLKTKNLVVLGTSEFFAEGTRIPMLAGRFFNGTEVQYRRNVVVLGNTAYKLLFEPTGTDPIGKLVRVGTERFEVVGVFDKRPTPGGFNVGAGRLRGHPLHHLPARVRAPRRQRRRGGLRHDHEHPDRACCRAKASTRRRRWPTCSG